MATDRFYFKAVNIESGEEKLVVIPPAVQVIAKLKLADCLKGDARLGFQAAIFGALNPDVMRDVAKGKMPPEAFMDALVEWLWLWEPDTSATYDSEGQEIIEEPETETPPAGDTRLTEAEPDPLP